MNLLLNTLKLSVLTAIIFVGFSGNNASAQSAGGVLSHPTQVIVEGDFAYVLSDSTDGFDALEIIDISNPAFPLHKSFIKQRSEDQFFADVRSFAVSGNYVYLGSYAWNAMDIVDVSDPNNPVVVKTFFQGDNSMNLNRIDNVYVSGNYLAVSSSLGHYVQILDISDPLDPAPIAVINTGFAPPTSLFISGDNLYYSYGFSIRIVDISDPAHPIQQGIIENGMEGENIGNISDIFVVGNKLYFIENDAGAARETDTMRIVDISDPLAPFFLGKISDGEGDAELTIPRKIFIKGDYAFITSYLENVLEIVDISDPAHPVHTGKFPFGVTEPYYVFVQGNFAYVTLRISNTLEVVDISDPVNPEHKGKISNGEIGGDPSEPPPLPAIKLTCNTFNSSGCFMDDLEYTENWVYKGSFPDTSVELIHSGPGNFRANHISILNQTNDYWWKFVNGLNTYYINFFYVNGEIVLEQGCTENCFSNLLFLPGLMGSKLYETTDIEHPLWPSVLDIKHAEFVLDSSGKSVNDIYTKNDTKRESGDFDETGIVDDILSFNIYKSFVEDLKDWKQEGTIADYDFIPYDWRLSLDDIINNGSVSPDGHISYAQSQDFSESFILKKLEELQLTSKTGKVTLIGHSNGGLVIKALVQKLKDTSNPLYDKIDKIIFVAVPQVGTPDAFVSLLHGSNVGPFGTIMKNERSRQLAENMPTIYNLLPSAGYFTTVDPGFVVDKIATFENTPFFSPQTSQYGVLISDETELKNYILGTDGRTKPAFADTVHPNIGNSTLYNQAQNVHQILDNWQPPANTKVIQVAGWGEETLAGLDYETRLNFNGTEKLSYIPRMVVDGDGTVVVPSALWMSDSNPSVERWWVDLAEEGGPIINRVHRDILEVSNLRDFVESKIKNTTFIDQDNIVVNNTSTLISNSSRLHYTLHSPLTLGVTDSQGKYTGQDPITKEIKEEIPGVNYIQIGEVQFISVPADIAHTLKLQGYQDGSFSLDVEKQGGNTITNFTSFQGIPASATTVATIDVPENMDVSTSTLEIDQNGDGTAETTLVATPNGTTVYSPTPPNTEQSLNELITLIKAKIQSLVANDKLKQNLSKKIENLEKKIENKKIKNAKILANIKKKISNQELKGKINTVDAVEISGLIDSLEAQAEDTALDPALLLSLKTKIQSLVIKANVKNDLLKRVENLEKKQQLVKTLSNLSNNIIKKGEKGKINDADAQGLLDLIVQIEAVI